MGRPKKYKTPEEIKMAKRISYEKALAKKDRSEVKCPCRHHKLKLENGLVSVDIGTMDRTKLDTAYVDMFFNVQYTDNKQLLKRFIACCKHAFYDWLSKQTMWDKERRIAYAEWKGVNSRYEGVAKTFNVQMHMRRDKVTSWAETVDSLTDLVARLILALKETCVETGLALVKYKIGNPTGKNQYTVSEPA